MKSEKINVLVTGAGGGGVGEGIVKALKTNSEKYRIVATDNNPLSAALLRVDKGYIVDEASRPQYVERLISICKREKIVAVIPGSIPELKKLSEARKEFEQEKITLIIGPKNLVDIGSDKWKFYEFLRQNNFSYPKTYLLEDSNSAISELNFPMYVKPREGYGSRYNYVAHDKEELEIIGKYLKKINVDSVVQEFIEGKECTVGVVVAKSGKTLGSVSIMRELKCGFSYRMIVLDVREPRKIAEEVALKLNAIGPLNVQFLMKEEKPVICEINPRFSGTTPIRTAVGFREVDAVLMNFLCGEEIQLKFTPKIVAIRYLDEVYTSLSVLNALERKGYTSAKGWRKRYF